MKTSHCPHNEGMELSVGYNKKVEWRKFDRLRYLLTDYTGYEIGSGMCAWIWKALQPRFHYMCTKWELQENV